MLLQRLLNTLVVLVVLRSIGRSLYIRRVGDRPVIMLR